MASVQRVEPAIRRAGTFDIGAIDKCNRELLPENYPLSFYRKFFRSPSCANFVVVDKVSGVLLGYVLSKAGVKRSVDEKGPTETIEGHIYSLAVRKEHQRKGYARALLSTVEQDLRRRYPPLACITLHVRQSNKGARHLYRACDYVRFQIAKNYYNNEHGVLMKKYLAQH